MATITRPGHRRPAKDEWGVYDPEQAGLAALFARIDAKDAKAAAAAASAPDSPEAPKATAPKPAREPQ
jgi:hypothetical protein